MADPFCGGQRPQAFPTEHPSHENLVHDVAWWDGTFYKSFVPFFKRDRVWDSVPRSYLPLGLFKRQRFKGFGENQIPFLRADSVRWRFGHGKP